MMKIWKHLFKLLESYMVNQLLAYYNNRPVKCSELVTYIMPDDFYII